MEVTRELVLPADPDEVWDAVTNPDRLEEWLANDVELDLAPGGDGIFRWETGEVRLAVVEDVEEGRLLRMRWWDEDAPAGATTVAIAIHAVEAGTRVVVTEATGAGFALGLQMHFSLVAA
jgi:uncharacterized protein YndB with AHSA1/START domain